MSKLLKFIDIGANLTDAMYSGVYNGSKKHEADLNQVLERSWISGVDKIIITGGNFQESKKALKIAKLDEKLYTTVGCHPTRCSEFDANPSIYIENLEDLIEKNREKVVAIGEIGLDYERTQFCPRETQKKYFELQLKHFATKFNLPLFLHCRNSADDLYEILRGFPGLRGVVHSFDGTTLEATRFLSLGFFIGLNGCSLKSRENFSVIKSLPVDKILLETDCPWCEIRPSHAGYQFISKENIMQSVKKEKWNGDCLIKSRNEPCNIRQVLDIVSAVRNKNPEDLSGTIYENTLKLFFSNK